MKGMKDSEYKACINNLGLLEGEKIRLQYVCFREIPTLNPQTTDNKKGLLVCTNENLIFMQQEGDWSSNYAQALRFSLEHISGIVSGGTWNKHLKISVGVSGASQQHQFASFKSLEEGKQIHEVRADVEKVLNESREERKRVAQEAMSKGTVPTMMFCRFCGARNKSHQANCASCGAKLN